ncbi:hypothetical protein R1T08_24200 [Streptomyces sp. SBC-4]|nr:hypothetical protein [Streptomyces sp. SBC-4]MDV5147193.1 hypothetical protein [Streptomyces sp. SBC-4]
MPDTAPKPRFTRTTKTVAVLVVLLIWTALAGNWTDKGCDFVPQSYFLVVSNGTPDSNEGCEAEPGGTSYTDNYRR